MLIYNNYNFLNKTCPYKNNKQLTFETKIPNMHLKLIIFQMLSRKLNKRF